MSMRALSIIVAVGLAAPALAQPTSYSTGFETFEGFSAGTTRTIGSSVFPQPLGLGGIAEDRTINQGVDSQGPALNPWAVPFANNRLDQEINVAGNNSRIGLNPAGVRSGSQSWRFGNFFHTGVVNAVLSPQLSAAGESGSGNNGTVARQGANNQVAVSFDFRSVADSYTPTERYLDISASITDAPGRRMAFLGLGEWDGTGRLVAYSSTVTGNSASNNTDFGASTLTDLQWGNWYNVVMTFNAIDGADNDVVSYLITDLSTNAIVANYTSDSWEEFYRQGEFGNPVGTVPGVNHVGFRSDYNADAFSGFGTDDAGGNPQMPFDSYSTFARPSGFYFDNFTVAVIPAPGAASLLALGGLLAARRRRN